eukprot:gnl/MRDRNA2_/MRDRNA2_30096_c0_seq1.p1 gnl/MRDRNA2_/MRDRNA2_30096_c0~~gnl/MRDRNA2_/MRDRNA2_30096_c0_seq1.p1  ORF type:complete len:480 (+),score=95.49 gnl/MRDRNA2_/MRDRNA2_30096_c0_seq1:123-1562(+)
MMTPFSGVAFPCWDNDQLDLDELEFQEGGFSNASDLTEDEMVAPQSTRAQTKVLVTTLPALSQSKAKTRRPRTVRFSDENEVHEFEYSPKSHRSDFRAYQGYNQAGEEDDAMISEVGRIWTDGVMGISEAVEQTLATLPPLPPRRSETLTEDRGSIRQATSDEIGLYLLWERLKSAANEDREEDKVSEDGETSTDEDMPALIPVTPEEMGLYCRWWEQLKGDAPSEPETPASPEAWRPEHLNICFAPDQDPADIMEIMNSMMKRSRGSEPHPGPDRYSSMAPCSPRKSPMCLLGKSVTSSPRNATSPSSSDERQQIINADDTSPVTSEPSEADDTDWSQSGEEADDELVSEDEGGTLVQVDAGPDDDEEADENEKMERAFEDFKKKVDLLKVHLDRRMSRNVQQWQAVRDQPGSSTDFTRRDMPTVMPVAAEEERQTRAPMAPEDTRLSVERQDGGDRILLSAFNTTMEVLANVFWESQ